MNSTNPLITELKAQAATILAQIAQLEQQEKSFNLAERNAAKALSSNNSGLMRQRMAELRVLQNETLVGARQSGTPEERRRWAKVMQWDRTYNDLRLRAELFERRQIEKQVEAEVRRGDCPEHKAAARRSDLWDKHMEALQNG